MKEENIKPIKPVGVKPAPPQLTEEPLKSDCTGESIAEPNKSDFKIHREPATLTGDEIYWWTAKGNRVFRTKRELESFRRRAAAKKRLRDTEFEIQQEYNNLNIFTKFWRWLKDLF